MHCLDPEFTDDLQHGSNIYYRGVNPLKLREAGNVRCYEPFFDKKYIISGNAVLQT